MFYVQKLIFRNKSRKNLSSQLLFQVFTANVLVGGTGGLHVPSIPEFKGKDSFKGEAFHSAHWKNGYDPTGRTVAIIGTGATSVQVLPAIADKVKTYLQYRVQTPYQFTTSKWIF